MCYSLQFLQFQKFVLKIKLRHLGILHLFKVVVHISIYSFESNKNWVHCQKMTFM